MDLLCNIRFYYDLEIELKSGQTYYYCIDQYTAQYLAKTLSRLNSDRFLVFMIANNTRCVAVSLSEILRFRIHPAFEKGEADYTDNFHVLFWPAEEEGGIPTYSISDLNVPSCLVHLKEGKDHRQIHSYNNMEAGELAGLDYELSGHANLRKFIMLNGITDSWDYIATESIIVLEADSDVLGIYLPV